MCECHLFTLTITNLQSRGWPERPCSIHGGGWLAVAAIWVSQKRGGRVAVRALGDLIAVCIIIIFPVSHYTGTLHQETHPISP